MNFIEIMSKFPMDPRYPEASQSDIIIKDTSINLIASPGDLIRCVSLEIPIVRINDNDLVVLEQTNDNSVQYSVRRVRKIGSYCELHCETNDSTWDTKPIIILNNRKNISQKIKAKVIWVYRNPFTPKEIIASLNDSLNKINNLEKEFLKRDSQKNALKLLTNRELEVLDLIAEGHQNKLIAYRLKLSQRTVENHRLSILKKTKARSLAMLLRIYFSSERLRPE
jgi:DNA-binding NarL/FixJ family response regulator